MRVLCAPDSFKGSMTATAAALAMAKGCRRASADIVCDVCPISDGGEGFVDAMDRAGHGTRIATTVMGPRCEPVRATWTALPDGTAVIEMAAASGLMLVPTGRRDPTRTTTFGTGQLVRAALDRGCRNLLIGIGGSATCDAGVGMAQALGARFLSGDGRPLRHPLAGGDLGSIRAIDLTTLDERLGGCTLRVACDVTNPLCGERGAAHVYGPQKGGTPDQLGRLDAGLGRIAALLNAKPDTPGYGAAGGLGLGLSVMLGAALLPGIGLVLDALLFSERLRGADLCLTGEGCLDGQTLSGKALYGVAQRARSLAVPTVALVGALGQRPEDALACGLTSYRVIGHGLPEAESMRRAEELLEAASASVVAGWLRDGGPTRP